MKTTTTLALARAERRLLARLEDLDRRLEDGEEVWTIYLASVAALAAIAPLTVPGALGEMLTTQQLADRLQLSTKTILRKAKRGELAPAVRMGARGRGALRWAAR